MSPEPDDHWTVEPGEPAALGAFLRARMPGRTWSDVKRLIATGKIRVDGEIADDAGLRVAPGQEVALRLAAPKPRSRGVVTVVHEDAHVVVIEKPAGIMSVPFETGDRGTAMDLLREAWRRRGARVAPLFVVHRIDKDTSGLLLFAKTRGAESDLGLAFRRHDIERSYLCVAHGRVAPQVIESELVEDRGDGLRGSSARGGKRAVTHVMPIESGPGFTVCEVRLETGRTHQIRIHLSEAGHPLVGERVYVRDALKAGRPLLPSPRLLLHAASLGFRHPVTGEDLLFRSPLPADFLDVLERLSGVS